VGSKYNSIEAGSSMKKKHIDVLIVQHNRKFACKFKDYIDKMQGFSVADFAFNGKIACEYARELKPDLIIVDMILSYIDGFGVIEELKKEEKFKDTKIILTSSIALDFALDRINSLPIDYFFVKPIIFKTFSDRINELFMEPKLDPVHIVECTNDRTIEFSVKQYLRKVGMPANVSGYSYLASAIVNASNGANIYGNLSNSLYPSVAKKHNTTATRVERSIRHAIELAWDRGDVETFDDLFGYTISENKGKPTNGEFIAMITDKVMIDLLNIE